MPEAVVSGSEPLVEAGQSLDRGEAIAPANLQADKAPVGPQSLITPATPAKLQPYDGPGGGHHVPAKSAFKGAVGYNIKSALAIPNEELDRLGIRHGLITDAQRELYRAFVKTGQPLAWEDVEKIETEALVRAKMNPEMAKATVRKAIDVLKANGITAPTKVPWGK